MSEIEVGYVFLPEADEPAEVEADLAPMIEPAPTPEWALNLDLLTVDEAAQVLKCGASTVYRAMKDGKLRSVRFGRCVRVRKIDLAAFVSRSVLSQYPGEYLAANNSVAETEGECKQTSSQ